MCMLINLSRVVCVGTGCMQKQWMLAAFVNF